MPSTVIDLSSGEPKLLRQGAGDRHAGPFCLPRVYVGWEIRNDLTTFLRTRLSHHHAAPSGAWRRTPKTSRRIRRLQRSAQSTATSSSPNRVAFRLMSTGRVPHQ